MLTVRDVMTEEVLTIDSGASVRELAQLLSRAKISGVPVVDAADQPVGVVTQSDLAAFVTHAWARPAGERRALGEEQWMAGDEFASETRVGDIMSPFVYFTHETTPLAELAELMVSRRLHRIVVMRGQRPVGMLSALDLVRGLVQELGRRPAPRG